MGCDDYPVILGDRYLVDPTPVAVQWNDALAQQFPNADHHGCRQSMRDEGDRFVPFDPPLCHGYHCPHCGNACGMYGHNNCQENQ